MSRKEELEKRIEQHKRIIANPAVNEITKLRIKDNLAKLEKELEEIKCST